MNKNSKIFVAGGTGMVGSAIIRKLVDAGYTQIISNYHARPPIDVVDYRFPNSDSRPPVTFFRLDLTNQQATETFFATHKPEYVFLAAAKVGGILANNTYKADFIYENIAIASNIIHASYKHGVKKLLNLGSSCIYPKLAPQPMKEEHLLTGPLEPTNEPYAIAKIAAIKLCRYYNEQYGTNFISVMPTNLYGPNDNFNLETSHVLPALIRKFHLAKLLEQGDLEGVKKDFETHLIGFGLDNKTDFSDEKSIIQTLTHLGIVPSVVNSPPDSRPSIFDFPISDFRHSIPDSRLSTLDSRFPIPVTLTLWGSGEVYREFLHVDDLADACVYLMEKVDAGDMRKVNADYFVNIGMGEDIKIRELASLMVDIVGFKGKIEHDLTKPDGTPKKLLDISRIKQLGWQPKIGLQEGIKKTYEWYLEHYR